MLSSIVVKKKWKLVWFLYLINIYIFIFLNITYNSIKKLKKDNKLKHI